MREKQLAICDKDIRYLEMFQTYLMRNKIADFQILIFDNLESARDISSKDRFEILLVSEGIYDDTVKSIQADRVFILREDGMSGIREYPFVMKYQSVESLISAVFSEYAQEINDSGQTNVRLRCGRNPTKLISVYAPDRSRAQTLAALAIGEQLSYQGKKVLYINLLPFAGFEELLGCQYDTDITDFVYYALKNSDKLIYQLESIKCKMGQLEYIPPALDYKDLSEISSKDWEKMTDILLYSGDYDDIVLDISETCQGFYRLLERSDDIYLVENNNAHSKAMSSQFYRLLELKENDRILKKLKKVELYNGWEQQDYDISAVNRTELGEYVTGTAGIK